MLWLALGCALTLRAQTDSSPASVPPATPATPPAPGLTVPASQSLVLELQDSLNSRRSRNGDRAHFITFNEVVVGYQVAIPRGSSVRATLTQVKKPGRGGRPARMVLRFDEIILPDGTTLPFPATLLRAGFTAVRKEKGGVSVKGEGGTSKRDVLGVAVNAGQGALLGAAIGGKKGAAYGGAIGAGIGLLGILLRRGPHLDLPRGMLFEVALDRELTVPATAVARFAQPGGSTPQPSPASAAASSPGNFTFPGDDSAAEPPEPIPDFDDDDTTTVATNREPSVAAPAPPPPATTAPPLPPEYDPTLGDPNAYRLQVDVRLVLVEAFVRDDRGQPLDNLTREDFLLFEDSVKQSIRHFSRDELPLAVALVVDSSGSVAPYMRELRRAAYQTLSELKPDDQVALFAFATDVERLEDLTTDRRRIAERIARIRASGGTNITDALFSAAQYLAMAARDRRRAIILISDNQITVRGHAGQGRTIRMALESDVVIYSIKTPGEPTPLMLRLPTWVGGGGSVRKITRETGGEIIDVERVGSLQAALATVISRLKTRYTLGYQPANKARDGAFRAIEVRLRDRFGRPQRDYTVHAKKGYYAPSEVAARATP